MYITLPGSRYPYTSSSIRINNPGIDGYYWSSSQNESSYAYQIYHFHVTNNQERLVNSNRSYALPVRCFVNHTYNVVFETNGGSDVRSLTELEGTKVKVPEIPTRIGYSFSGWYLSGSDVEWDFSTDIITGDTTLYAKWNKILTLDLEGGEISESGVWKISEDGQIARGLVGEKYGGLPIPVQTGYKFEGWSRLPSGYQEVEYIESHGEEYIDTKLIPTIEKETEIVLSVSRTKSSNPEGFGSNLNLDYGATNPLYWRVNGKQTDVSFQDNKFYNLVMKQTSLGRYYSIDGSGDGYGSVTEKDNPFYVGMVSGTKGYVFYGKFKEILIKEKGNVVLYLIPAYDELNDEYGLYDLVSDKFFRNEGEGEFSGGNIVYVHSGDEVEENTFNLYAKWAPMYSVQFKSGDNILQSGYVESGVIPEYEGDIDDLSYIDSGYVYMFSGWNPAIEMVSEDKVYTAEFSGYLIPVCSVEYSPNSKTSGNVEVTLTGCNQEGVDFEFIDDVDFAELKNGRVIFSGNGILTGNIKNSMGITGALLLSVSWIDRNQPSSAPEEPAVLGRSGGGRRGISNSNESEYEMEGEVEEDLLYDSNYSDEMNESYLFAFENDITTMTSISEANMNGTLTRIAMAKMLSQYAINVLGKTPDTTRFATFTDVSAELDAQYNSGVTLAYQLGIMGINLEGKAFRPNDEVTRAEFATALSRLLFATPDGEDVYYTTHLAKLMSEGIITNDNPTMKELRGYVMIMLMRSAK